MPDQWILILDYGSQYTQLIARRIREQSVYCEIHPFNKSLTDFEQSPPTGVILSGGPKSVNDEGAPALNPDILSSNIPVLGICYGLQLLIDHLIPGSIAKADHREFGRSDLIIDNSERLFQHIPKKSVAWMSHGDHIQQLPEEYTVTARTNNDVIAAVQHQSNPFYGVQFHPEVVHTEYGNQILQNFVRDICGVEGGWTTESFIQSTIKKSVKSRKPPRIMCTFGRGRFYSSCNAYSSRYWRPTAVFVCG